MPRAMPSFGFPAEEESHCRWGTVEEIPSLGRCLRPCLRTSISDMFCAPLVLGDELQKIRLEILGDFEL